MNGQTIVQYDDNPILNTWLYDIMFPGVLIDKYFSNLISENLYIQLDEYDHI